MWQNSNELLDYALRELKKAVSENKSELEIVLKEQFVGGGDDIQQICKSLKIKVITKRLRKEFCDYDIRSIVEEKRTSDNVLIITYRTGCDLGLSIVWRLIISPK